MEDTMKWRKSSYSSSNGGECIEVANDSRVLVRDTKNGQSPILRFTPDSWRRLVEQIKRSLASTRKQPPAITGGCFRLYGCQKANVRL
jgi:hypothetical protein